MRIRSLLMIGLGLLSLCASHAWDYEGHRAINQLALSTLPPEFPSFVKEPAAQERIAFLAGEPDRWRNAPDLPIRHYNAPDHYFDFEDAAAAGLKLETLSEFRYIVTAQFAEARATHPERFAPIDPEKDKDHTRELLGYLPWTITEYFGKLKSAFSYLKILEELGSPEEIANAQANVLYVMGVMGHYVGDGSQPLHSTTNHNGWVGDNPHGYTTSNRFHSWIDGGFLGETGPLSIKALAQEAHPATLLPSPSSASGVNSRDPVFSEIISYLGKQYEKVVPLYELDKAGKLSPKGPGAPEGRRFLEQQIVIGAEMLGQLWFTAWREAPPDTYLRASLLKRKNLTPKP